MNREIYLMNNVYIHLQGIEDAEELKRHLNKEYCNKMVEIALQQEREMTKTKLKLLLTDEDNYLRGNILDWLKQLK